MNLKSKENWIIGGLQKPLFLSLVGGMMLTAALFYFDMNSYEGTLYDLRMRLKMGESRRSEIVLVTIDQNTLQTLRQAPPPFP